MSTHHDPLPPDHLLAAATRSGSAESFESLVERYHGAVLRYLARQTGDPELAADLTQQTFLDAFEHLDRLAEDRPFAPWLYRIARNHLLHARRARRRRVLSLDQLSPEATQDAPALRQPDVSVASHERDVIQCVLDELGPALREALLLHSLWGFSSEEIAGLLDISLAASRKRVGRAKEQFSRRYEALSGGGR